MTISWVATWLFFWAIGLGITNYLFKKYKVTYYENPWQHTAFFLVLCAIISVVYYDQFHVYFYGASWVYVVVLGVICTGWLLAPVLYKHDYYTKKERFRYQLPKFFEVLFQDLCFLGGLLTFGLAPAMFGLVFFLVHIPAVFVLPKKFALLPIIGSLFGGVIFANLQTQGARGFFIALFVHLLFWASLQYILQQNIFGVTPLKR